MLFEEKENFLQKPQTVLLIVLYIAQKLHAARLFLSKIIKNDLKKIIN